jgi:biotin carboxylase
LVARDRGARGARLLVLGAGPAQLGLLETARARADLHVIAVDRDPSAVAFPLAHARAILSTEDEPAVERLARAEAVDGIVSPGADWTVGVAARVAERMGLPHPIDGATAGLATWKSRQRERLAEAGVPQPRVIPAGESPTVPCVVKAPDRQGQRGLTLVQEPGELEAAVAAAVAASRSGGYLVEELVEGPEVTVNAVSVEGKFVPLAVNDRITADPPAFGVALAHVWPSDHDTAAAAETARLAVAALGIRNGPTYTQVRLGRDAPRVMEVAARLGGGHDAELVEAGAGVDLNALAIQFALGERASNSLLQGVERSGGACVAFLVAPVGRMVDVTGVADAESMPGVRWVRVYRRPGWEFAPLRRGVDRAGAVLAVGASREQALERARRAADAVRFQVDANPS